MSKGLINQNMLLGQSMLAGVMWSVWKVCIYVRLPTRYVCTKY